MWHTHYAVLLSPSLPRFILKDVLFSVIFALEKLVISLNKVNEYILKSMFSGAVSTLGKKCASWRISTPAL